MTAIRSTGPVTFSIEDLKAGDGKFKPIDAALDEFRMKAIIAVNRAFGMSKVETSNVRVTRHFGPWERKLRRDYEVDDLRKLTGWSESKARRKLRQRHTRGLDTSPESLIKSKAGQ